MSKCEHHGRLGFRHPCGAPAVLKIRRKSVGNKVRWRYFCQGCADYMLPRIHDPIHLVKL